MTAPTVCVCVTGVIHGGRTAEKAGVHGPRTQQPSHRKVNPMSHIIKRLRVIVLTGAVLLTSTGAALAASPWLLHVWGGSGDDGSGVELAGDEV
ncbi:MAG: hypothetical protein ABSH51_32685, partial [Solirubrobacteraceae bacterium]